jgi:hypothetical protein
MAEAEADEAEEHRFELAPPVKAGTPNPGLMLMMAEEPFAILKEVPDDKHIER